jgi:hypothetical protein
MFDRFKPWAVRLMSAALACVPLLAAARTAGAGATTVTAAAPPAHRIRHVFIVVLENKDFADTFHTSTQNPYLQKTLVPMGGLLSEYHGTGHVSLDNYIAMISGQSATPYTQYDCVGPTGAATQYLDVVKKGETPDGQVIASVGCIYPRGVKTLPGQLQEAGLTWKGYMEDMGNDPRREAATCGHPAVNGPDGTATAEAPSPAVPGGDQYAARHDPFVYFHDIIDSAECASHVVNLRELSTDLRTAATTPNFAFITPNLCNDGHDGDGTGAAGKGCVNGQPGGLSSADAFLRSWVPQILQSPAYQEDGLLIVTFDEGNYRTVSSTAPATGQKTVNITFLGEACCHQPLGPNITPTTVRNLVNTPQLVENVMYQGYGGDQIGALLLSRLIEPGSSSSIPYNHYSLLRSLEDIFHLKHLGYAADNPATGYTPGSFLDDPHIFKAR